jgi:hypothetical protein
MTKLSLLLLGLAAITLSASAWAFPANVRHGYPNCTACHISPSGGGVLSPYGRALSREVQSTWGTESESGFAWGAVKTPEWLDLGTDTRYLQMVSDTPSTVEGKSFWMAADAEAAVHVGKLTLDGSIGWKGNNQEHTEDAFLISRRHFAMYTIDDHMAVRAGRFYPTYGLMQAEHEDATRAGLGFDPGMESYNLEFSMQDENGSLFVSPIFGKLSNRNQSRRDEKGLAVSKNFMLGSNSRVGFSALYGKTFFPEDTGDFGHRFVFGPNAIVAISKSVFWLVEADVERRKLIDTDVTQTAIYQYQKLSFEPQQGLILSLRQDWQRTNLGDPDNATGSQVTAGPVIDWYPRPHFDLQLAMTRDFLPESTPNIWVYTGMLHIYL